MDERRGLLARLRLTGSFALRWYREVIADLLPSGIRRGLTALAAATYRKVLGSRLDGGSGTPRLSTKQFTRFELSAEEVVYTSVFNPHDGRKNWHDLVTAFCTALSTRDDATLILKFVHHDCTTALAELAALLARLRSHRCRVIAVTGYLDNASYRSLVERTTFVANCSLSEGQCLPLMEFMSGGKPAIATENTAMAEYIGSDVAFVVGSSPEPCGWPHDVRNVFRAHRYRVDWQSLVCAFRRSYAVAKEEPALYAAMAQRASARLRDHCSEGVALEALSQFLGLKEDHTIRTHSSAPGGPAVMTDDVLPRLAAAGYFSGAVLPKLESDYEEFDPSRDHDARQLVEKFGIVVRGDALSTNRVYLHKGCGRLAYASTFTFHGGGNVVVLGELNGFHGSLTFEGRDNVVALMGHHRRLALDATLYQGDTLVCGRGVFAWGLRVWVQGGTTCTIGDDCLLSENISIRTTDHHSIIDLKTQRSTNVPADIDIGRHVWIGPNCVVNKGVKIGDGSILATNTVVTGSIPSTELWGGIPARQIRKDVSWVRSFPPDQAEVGALFRVLDSASIAAFGKGGAELRTGPLVSIAEQDDASA
jgi:acetyltransferase-like isoleucine patch superfamily enzyme